MDREQALTLINKYIKNENLIKHCLASEAVLKALAREIGENEAKWALAGLLHDIDVETTNADLSVHTKEAANILKEAGLEQELIDAIRLHNEKAHPGEKRNTKLQYALAAGETITGLIIATALVYPDKKLSSVKVKSITKRMKEKAFARSVNRDIIMECENIGFDITRFSEIALQAMQEIAGELGL